MKTLYTSPVITVEELTKADVLCTSSEFTNYSVTSFYMKKDNINQTGGTIGDLSGIL